MERFISNEEKHLQEWGSWEAFEKVEEEKDGDQVLGDAGQSVAGVVQFFGREVWHHVLRWFGGIVAMFVGLELVILSVKSVRWIHLKFIVHALRLPITGRTTRLAAIFVRRSMEVALRLPVRTSDMLRIDRVEAAVRVESIDLLGVVELALGRRADGQFGRQLAVIVDTKRTVEEVALLNEKRQTVVHQISK